MTVIQLPDEQAAALTAKAAAEGLTLADWLGKLAATETPISSARERQGRYRLAQLMAKCDPNAALTAEDRDWLGAPVVGREGGSRRHFSHRLNPFDLILPMGALDTR